MTSVLSHKTNLEMHFSYGQTEVETAATLVNYM